MSCTASLQANKLYTNKRGNYYDKCVEASGSESNLVYMTVGISNNCAFFWNKYRVYVPSGTELNGVNVGLNNCAKYKIDNKFVSTKPAFNVTDSGNLKSWLW